MSMRDLILFCGMGGATDGLARAGWQIGACVDGWDKACLAHRRWHPTLSVVQARVEDADKLLDFRPRFVWASPSCKPWSIANRTANRGMAHKEYYSLARLVAQVFGAWRARWFVIENVCGLLWSTEGKAEMALLRGTVARFGLVMTENVIPSNTLGIRQLRRRLFIVVGPRLVKIAPGGVLLPKEGTVPMLWESSRAERPVLGGRHGPQSAARTHNWPKRTSASVLAMPSNGAVTSASFPPGAHTAWPRATRAVEAGEHPGRLVTRERKYEARGRTLEECAALQQVPLEPLAEFSRRVAHELVGNAVPPAVAEHVGSAVLATDGAISREV